MIAQFRQLAAPVTDSVCTVWAGHVGDRNVCAI